MAGLVLLALMGSAQRPGCGAGAGQAAPAPGGSRRAARADRSRTTTRRNAPGQALDSATAGRLGIPTAPTRSFAPDDSVTQSLLKRGPGYRATRYRADSATVFIEEQRVLLAGAGADRAPGRHARGRYDHATSATAACSTRAGDPHLFDRGQVLVGEGIRYDTCRRRGIVWTTR